MAIKLVQFEDKENINTNPDLPRINKVTNEDINELKDTINNNANELGKEADSRIWNLLGSTSGTTALNLPDEFLELYIEVDVTQGVHIPFYIIKETLENEGKNFSSGWWQTGTTGGRASIKVSNTQYKLNSSYVNGDNTSSSSTTTIYYRN